jgi:prepilin-type N-terminal cleavage/methylation domain-containing protein
MNCSGFKLRQRAGSGFTLIEIMIVVALMVILTAIYVVVANPAGQLAQARNNERRLHLQAIMNAVQQNIADSGNEQFTCAAGPIPTSSVRMTSAVGAGNYNIAPCIVFPTGIYGLFTMPFDPVASSSHFISVNDYDSGYSIAMNASGSILLSAPYAELNQVVKYP